MWPKFGADVIQLMAEFLMAEDRTHVVFTHVEELTEYCGAPRADMRPPPSLPNGVIKVDLRHVRGYDRINEV